MPSSKPRGTNEHGRRSFLAAVAISAVSGCSATDGGQDTSPTLTDGTPSDSPVRRETTERERQVPDYVYLDRDQLGAVGERAKSGTDPWASGYQRVLSDARDALELTPQSVVEDGAPAWDDEHRFGKDPDRHDYRKAIAITNAVRDTALAYRLTGEDVFAKRSIDLLYHWCLSPDTHMAPSGNMANNGVSIELWITIPKLWYGAALLSDHGYWESKDVDSLYGMDDLEQGFRKWVRQFIESIPDPGYEQKNNIWAWRIQTIAGAGTYLGDTTLVEKAFDMWRAERVWSDYEPMSTGGALRAELNREDGLQYHVYGTKALAMTAEIARHQGVDLYGYTAPTDPGEGSTLRKLLEFMLPYLLDDAEWQWGTGSEGVGSVEQENYGALYELGYSIWEDEAYLDVVRSVGRPVYDFWMLGWISFTHGNLFDLNSSE